MKNQYDVTVRFFRRYRVSFIELSFILIQEIRNQKEKPTWISNNIRELGSVSNPNLKCLCLMVSYKIPKRFQGHSFYYF